jgi:hypothetical protein
LSAQFASQASVSEPQTPRPPAVRSLEEQQAALNLTQLSGQGDAPVNTLIDAILVSATYFFCRFVGRILMTASSPKRIQL